MLKLFFWERYKLKDITKSFSGGTPDSSISAFYKGEIPFIRSAEINSFSTHLKISEEGLVNSSAKLVKKGDILYAMYGATSGEVGIARINGAINQAILALDSGSKQLNNFLYFYLKKNRNRYILKYLQGGQGNLSSKIINNYEVIIPSEKEVMKISNMFCELDKLVDLYQCKLDHLKSLKQEYLRLLFTDNYSNPILRFKGFTDDWEQEKLHNLVRIIGGGTPSTTTEKYWNGDIDWYTPKEVGKDKFLYKSERTITELGLEKSSAKLLPAENTLLFTSRANIGDFGILKTQAATNQGFQSLIVNPEEVNIYFLYGYAKQIKEYALKQAIGSTFLEISGKELGKMTVIFPKIKEQKNIGKFLELIDNLISLYQRKLDNLNKLKNIYLQKLFI